MNFRAILPQTPTIAGGGRLLVMAVIQVVCIRVVFESRLRLASRGRLVCSRPRVIRPRRRSWWCWCGGSPVPGLGRACSTRCRIAEVRPRWGSSGRPPTRCRLTAPGASRFRPSKATPPPLTSDEYIFHQMQSDCKYAGQGRFHGHAGPGRESHPKEIPNCNVGPDLRQ